MVNKKLTIDDALVPKDEIPYEVPENWCWVKLEYISDLVTGNTPSKNNKEYYGSDIPFIKPTDLNQGRYLNSSIEYLSHLGGEKARLLPKGSTSVCCIGATIGKIAYLNVDGATNQQINSIIPNKQLLNDLYVYYYTLSNQFQSDLISNSSSTTLPIINKSRMGKLSVPLPPLAEQERIVNRIESLFEKVDKASELVKEAREGFEKRRSAILEKAFSGALIQSKPQYIKLKECGEFIKDKKEPEIYDNYLGLEHFISGYGISNYSTGKNVKSTKSKFLKGDILYGRLRPYLDKHDIADKDGICSTDILIFRCNKDISINKYINYFMSTNRFKSYAIDNSQGINLPRVSAKVLNELEIPIFTIKEQNKIVDILDNMINKEFNIDELTNIDESIKMIRKSILAKAFRGELGGNDLSEESSIDLLKEIL